MSVETNEAYIGYGSHLYRGASGPPTTAAPDDVYAAAMAGITEVGTLKLQRALLDATTTESPNGFTESRKSMKDVAPIQVEAHFLPSDSDHNFATGLGADWSSDDARNFKWVLSDGTATAIYFAAQVFEMEILPPLKDLVRLKFSLKITGPVTLAGTEI